MKITLHKLIDLKGGKLIQTWTSVTPEPHEKIEALAFWADVDADRVDVTQDDVFTIDGRATAVMHRTTMEV